MRQVAVLMITAIAIAAPAAAEDDATVHLVTLDPGHFHAALVQKTMYDGVSPVVRVYAPAGSDVEDHLRRIESFSTRADAPTSWDEQVYTGDDFLEKMLVDRRGNPAPTIAVISGNNRRKADYILACAEAGINVLADKPMCIDAKGYAKIRRAFEAAEANGSLIYDMMTERSSITMIIMRELMQDAELFGDLVTGSPEAPAIQIQSVHHFFKHVAGKPIKRPGWYFDTTQQGEGIVDVTTHLIDLSMWLGFPGRAVEPDDVEVVAGRRWPTMISPDRYRRVTWLDGFIQDLRPALDAAGNLPCHANGQIDYTINGVHARVRVEWKYEAPAGQGDTHASTVRGTGATILLAFRRLMVQGPDGVEDTRFEERLKRAVVRLQDRFPGVGLAARNDDFMWEITIPPRYRTGHEAHFADVMERSLVFLELGRLPDWEVPNMLAKYATTTRALELARRSE